MLGWAEMLYGFDCADGACRALQPDGQERVRRVQIMINAFSRSAGFAPLAVNGAVDMSTVAAANKINAYMVSKKLWSPATVKEPMEIIYAVLHQNLGVVLADALAKAKPAGFDPEKIAISVGADGTSPTSWDDVKDLVKSPAKPPKIPWAYLGAGAAGLALIGAYFVFTKRRS